MLYLRMFYEIEKKLQMIKFIKLLQNITYLIKYIKMCYKLRYSRPKKDFDFFLIYVKF